MKHLSEYFISVGDKLAFPADAHSEFCRVAGRLDNEPDSAAEFDSAVSDYMFNRTENITAALDRVAALAGKQGENEYTLDFVFILACSEILLDRYREANISEAVFYNTMTDLRCKLNECLTCKGVPGIFVGYWYEAFFKMTRFGLGRFQYEKRQFTEDYTAADGTLFKKGDVCLNFHIPSTGEPISADMRFDSYRRAYEFFPEAIKEGKLALVCHSWLLFPDNRDFLPSSSNILRFMDDFDIVRREPEEPFSNSWRIFGAAAQLPPEELPENTSLQQAFKKRLCEKAPVGNGFGIIIFDGEKITKNDQ